MRLDVERWLAQLPIAHPRASAEIAIDGCLISGGVDDVRVLVGPLCLTLRRADVLAAQELDGCACGVSATSAIHVRLVIRRGAPLLDAYPSDIHADRIRGRAPFALSSRPPVIRVGGMPRFRALERAFMTGPSVLPTDEG